MKKTTLLICLLAMSMFSQEWYISIFDTISNTEVRVDTSNGLYAIGTIDESIAITHNFNAPESVGFSMGNAVTFRIAGESYRSHSSFPRYTDYDLDDYFIGNTLYEEDNMIISIWEIPSFSGNIQLLQRLSFVSESESPVKVNIEYEISNEAALPATAGIKLFINNEFNEIFFGNPRWDPRGILDDLEDIWPVYMWQICEENIYTDSLQYILTGEFGYDIPDYIGHGEYFAGDYPLSANPWHNDPETWVDAEFSDLGTFLKWDESVIGPGGIETYNFYFSQRHDYYEVPEIDFDIYDVYHSGMIHTCRIDSIVESRAVINSWTTFDETDTTFICLDFNDSSELEIIGHSCDTFHSIITTCTFELNFQIRIPDGYSDSCSIIDTLLFNVSGYYLRRPASATFTHEIRIPYIDHTPPEVIFLDTAFVYECSTSVRFAISDEDTTPNYSSLLLSYVTEDTIYNFTPSSGIFDVVDDVLYCRIDTLLEIPRHDIIELDGDFDICINQLKDMFRCAIDTYCVSINMGNRLIYDLDIGWNMISFPFDTAVSISAFLPESPAPYYIYDNPSYRYEAVELLEPCIGLWYYSDYDSNVIVKGPFATSGTIELFEGWTLIGMPYDTFDMDALAGDSPIANPSFFFDPDSVIYIGNSILTPTHGYFILSTDSTTIHIE